MSNGHNGLADELSFRKNMCAQYRGDGGTEGEAAKLHEMLKVKQRVVTFGEVALREYYKESSRYSIIMKGIL